MLGSRPEHDRGPGSGSIASLEGVLAPLFLRECGLAGYLTLSGSRVWATVGLVACEVD